MNSRKLILFGASKLGRKALIHFSSNRVMYFCDNDITKVGNYIEGIKIISFDELINIHEKYEIVITSMYKIEIAEQLRKNNITNYRIYNEKVELDYNIDGLKEINLGDFIQKCDFQITLDSLTFFEGGSTILDYVFLKAIAKKFNRKKYLEIGSFMGESIACLSDVVDECVSLSLENKELDNFFKMKKKKNFSSYFMDNLVNVRQIKADSKKFDLKMLNFNPDFVFIDGDHSYDGVYSDTQKIFNIIDSKNTIVIWHDFRFAITKKVRTETIKAVLDALDVQYHNNIFICDNNLCGIYIPDKYFDYFKFKTECNEIYSYNIQIFDVKRNLR